MKDKKDSPAGKAAAGGSVKPSKTAASPPGKASSKAAPRTPDGGPSSKAKATAAAAAAAAAASKARWLEGQDLVEPSEEQVESEIQHVLHDPNEFEGGARQLDMALVIRTHLAEAPPAGAPGMSRCAAFNTALGKSSCEVSPVTGPCFPNSSSNRH